MFWHWIERGGSMMYPLLAISFVVWGLILERFLYWRRVRGASGGEREALLADAGGHERRIQPLAAVAVSVGLMGSVVGMIQAFGGFQQAIDSKRVSQGLAVAFYTTEIGLTISIASMLACYLFSLWEKRLTALPVAVPTPGPQDVAPQQPQPIAESVAAVAALMRLGVGRREAEERIGAVAVEGRSADDLVRAALSGREAPGEGGNQP